MLGFSQAPYFNDFDEENKFYSILFRPSVAVQARELNQFQTILQNQIKKHGDHIFKNGTVVIPGEFAIKSSVDYVTLADIGNSSDVKNLIGITLKNTTNLEALVIHAESAIGTDPATLYLSYTKSGTNQKFANSEILSSLDDVYSSIDVAPTNSTGTGSLASIQRGVYYINGYFVLCDTQTIVLDKYTSAPTYKIGFNVVEATVSSDDVGYDSLLDNAQGTYNYAAPGAHRYFIDLILTALPIDTESETFTELGRVASGVVLSSIQNTGYAQLEKTFARRTYDESGDYTVRPFPIDIREHRNNDRVTWSGTATYKAGDIVTNSNIKYTAFYDMGAGLAAPSHTSGIVGYWEQTTYPTYNRGIYSPDVLIGTVGDSSKLALGLEPGKAYVQGFEIEKKATTYIEIDKPRSITLDTEFVNNASVPTSVGSYVQVRDVYKINSATAVNALMSYGSVVTLYDSIVTTAGTLAGSPIGTCKIRSIQTESGTGSTTYCRMFIYDVKMYAGKDFARDVKSFYNATAFFTANVTYDTYSVAVGSITVSGTTATGFGTTWADGTVTPTIKIGDYIYYNTNKAQVIGVTNTQLALAGSPTASSVQVGCLRVQTQLVESNNTSLVFPLPNYATYLVQDHIYYVTQFVTAIPSGTDLALSGFTGTLQTDASNYYVQDTATGLCIGSSGFTVDVANSKLVFPATLTSTYTVFATVKKTGASVAIKTKTLTYTTTPETFTTGSTYTINDTIIQLGHSDGYKLVKILMGAVDITDWYTFDDGQRDSYYNYASITLKPSYPTPTTTITVYYQYFVHTDGDFFDRSSYINIDYSLIPYYNGVNLRDVIDFRPRVDRAGGFNLSMPKRGYDMSVDLTYFLARQDKISLDLNGKFFDTKGSSSLNPGVPGDSSTGMTICTLMLAPYTFNTTSDVVVTKVENKRYTMRDIGKLEKRIDNIEYYTSLSMLEQETSSLSITDSKGLDRFKNGFIVDNFTGHNIGDVVSPDYICAIDMENGELRPATTVDNVNLLVDTSTSTNYKLYGDVVTLPLDVTTPHVELAKNPYASRTENVNPFAVFTFLGNVKLNPSSDDWFEVNRVPDLITNVEGNYSNLVALAEKTGLIGTVWNAWQNQWAGTPLLTSSSSKQIKDKTRPHFIAGDKTTGWLKNIKTDVYATQIGQSRTGIKTTAVANIESHVVDDKVLSIAMIPYMRSRNILIQVKGLKPNTRFYPYFDNIAIASYCTGATNLYYTPIYGTFDSETNSGINSTLDIVRRISNDNQVCLNIGDVITGASSGKKAVVVGKERTVSNTGAITYKLFILNATGSFTSGEVLTGSISGATGTYSSIGTNPNYVTGSSGDLNILFNIPNTDAIRFRTGSREFKLIDTSTASGQFTSKGVAPYEASGTIQTKQAHVVSTRNVEFVREQVSDTQTITDSSRVVSEGGWYDPLAQTFLVESTGGAFLSKVDLFFASKDGNIPVSIEIREVVNGYPGKAVLPFSRVTVKSEDVKLSSTSVLDYAGVSYPTFDTPTTISFPSPIYVKDKTSYALVVLSDSNNYKLWISQMGDIIPGTTDSKISEQPYLGVLFKSQNASTWTASQDQDLKFTMWRANFDISNTGNLILINDLLPRVTLMNNPVQILLGSPTVRVWHDNHGFKAGDSVTFSGAVSTDTTITTALLNTTFVISNPTLDSYTVVVGANATNTGFIGGSVFKATRNIRYETMQPNISTLGFSDTTTNYSIITTEMSTGFANTEESCIVNDNNYYRSSKTIPSSITGALQVKVAMNSVNTALSPIIDTHGASAIAVGNKIDSPTSAINIAGIDNNKLWNGAINSFTLYSTSTNAGSFIVGQLYTITAINDTDFRLIGASANVIGKSFIATGVGIATVPTVGTATVNQIRSTTNQAILKRVIPGTYIQLAGSTIASNDGQYLVYSVDSNGYVTVLDKIFIAETATASSLIYYFNSFFDEMTPSGSSTFSKYVSKEITLANQSNVLRIRYAVSAPTESDVLVYYKTGTSGTSLSTVNWTLLAPDKTMPKTTIGSNTFYDVDYTAELAIGFDILTVKLVMKSTNTAAIPRVKDLRIIACAK